MLKKSIVGLAALLGCATTAEAANPVIFVGQAVVTKAPENCPGVGTIMNIVYRIDFGDRPDALYLDFPWGAGRELRPKGRETFASRGTLEFAEANGYGFWTGDVPYSGFKVIPATNTASAKTIRITLTHEEPNGQCKFTLDAGLAREG